MPRVSALIPTYNRADHVEGAIQTVLGQTYDDIEAVVVNDGSTDDTDVVLDGYADDPRVVVRHNHRNRGIAYSFNRAAEAASGELLCILGDDDRWHPEKVRRQVTRMDDLSEEYAVVYTGGVDTSVESGRVITQYRPDMRGDIYPDVLESFGLAPHSSHMIRRSCFEAVDGFDTAFSHGVDWEMNIRLARRYKFDYISKPLVNRRIHDTNVSQTVESQARLYGWIHDKFADQYRQFPEIDRAFRHERHRLGAHAAIQRGDRLTALGHCARAGRLSRPGLMTALFLSILLGRRTYRTAKQGYGRVAALIDRFTGGPDTPLSDDFGRLVRSWWGDRTSETEVRSAVNGTSQD
jgi:glycosyltransferase involved in cell wall biosynthesis